MTAGAGSEVLAALVAALDRREPVALVTVTGAGGRFAAALGRRALIRPDAEAPAVGDLALAYLTDQALADARAALAEREHRCLRVGAGADVVELFVEVQAQPPHLVIVGAGHIAVPLAAIAKINDFEVTVLDDRPQYAHRGRFPTADRVVAGPFTAELRRLRGERPAFDAQTYVVLVTRGHQHDVECLIELLDDPVAYLGMIGSQRRIRAVFELLERENGIPAQRFDRVYAPIGLAIGARTPAEIAVCIMAEIINVMRGGAGLSLSEEIRRERQARRTRLQGG